MKESKQTRSDGGLTQLDRYLRALSDQQRRYLLYHLDEHGVSTTEKLAQHIAAWESDCSPTAVPTQEYKPIQAKLHHQHLPKLKEYGIVEYDKRNKDVCLDNPSQIFTILLQFCQLVDSSS